MASKLELRFTSPGISGERLTIGGQNYTFLSDRLGPYQVKMGTTTFDTARNFHDAFQSDANYTGQFTLTLFATSNAADGTALPEGTMHSLVTIEHQDNTYFDSFINQTNFITHTIELTPLVVEPTVDASFGQAVDACGKYKLIITTNRTAGTLTVEHPIGTKLADITVDGSASYEIELPRPAAAQTGIITYSDNVKRGEVLFNPPPVLSIQSVDVEGSPFGAFATINATSGLSLEYSLNGTDWNGSGNYGGLLAGNFTAYVRDLYGCQKTKAFIVTEEQASGLTVPPLF